MPTQASTSNDSRLLRTLVLGSVVLLVWGGCQSQHWAMGLEDSPQGQLPEEEGSELSESGASAQTDGMESQDGDSADAAEDSAAEDSSGGGKGESGENPSSSCGNGIVEPPEDCDDANDIDTDDCLSNCKLPRCGDEIIWEGHEECEAEQEELRPRCKSLDPEPGHLHNPESPLDCDSKCQLSQENCAYCGDEVIQSQFGEVCEGALACNDPRIDARYYDSEQILAKCAFDCRSIDASACGFCGDDVIQEWANERCDDGNSSTSDSCPHCQPARCGDGFVWAGHEDCDPGSTSKASEASTCAAICGERSEPIPGANPPSRQCKNEGENACRWGAWDCRGCKAP